MSISEESGSNNYLSDEDNYPPEGSMSFINSRDDENASTIWKMLFESTEFLDQRGKEGLKFLILGIDLESILRPDSSWTLLSKGQPVLAIAILATKNPRRLTRSGWGNFLKALKPHTYDPENYEIKFEFKDLKITLNAYNLFYDTKNQQEIIMRDPDRLFWSKYNSGDVLELSTSAIIYKGRLENDWEDCVPGPIPEPWNMRL